MSSILRFSSRLRAPISSAPLGRPVMGLNTQRAYVHDTPKKYAQANEHEPDEKCERDNKPNHPIPSNNAHPTLRDGRQTNLSDMEGKPHEELPEDVRKHNEEMEDRYDKPYNHISDKGTVDKVFKAKE